MGTVIDDPRYQPSTPRGYALRALEGGAADIKSVRDAMPFGVVRNFTEDQILQLVREIPEWLLVPPPTAELILLEDHLRRKHKRAKTPPQHHADELIRLRREVRLMAKPKTKAKGKAKGKAAENGGKPERELKDCHCGCGGQTYGNFSPGHDARVYSLLRKESDGEKVKLPAPLIANKELLAAMREKVH